MLIEACSRTHSTASDLVLGSFDLAGQPTEEYVDVPTEIVFGRASPAMSLDAKQLLKKGTKLFHDLYFKWTVEDEAILFLGNQLSFALERVGIDLWRTKAQELSVTIPKRVRLWHRLLAAFEAEPLEDGMNHPAEQIIRQAFQFSEGPQIFDWFESFSLDAGRPSFAASVLRCLGRQTNLGTDLWRARLVRAGLTVDNVEIRDAAVQVAESWGGQELVEILRSHNEPESWLREYIWDVINDLEE